MMSVVSPASAGAETRSPLQAAGQVPASCYPGSAASSTRCSSRNSQACSRSDSIVSTAESAERLTEATVVIVTQIVQQLEQASNGDGMHDVDSDQGAAEHDLREVLKARVRHVGRLVELSSAHLTKALLQRTVDVLREMSVAIESYELSKGFPFLRGVNTANELTRHLKQIKELIEEMSVRIHALSSPSSLAPNKGANTNRTVKTAGDAWCAQAEGRHTDIAPPPPPTRPAAPLSPSSAASSSMPASPTMTGMPPTPASASSSSSSGASASAASTAATSSVSGCVLLVQKSPDRPGQLQHEWQQAAPRPVKSRGSVREFLHFRGGLTASRWMWKGRRRTHPAPCTE